MPYSHRTSFAHRRRPVTGWAAAALLTLGGAAQAGIDPILMQMSAKSSSCISDCAPSAKTVDTDNPDPLYGSFGNFAVATSTAPDLNAFFTQADGSTTVTSDTSFTVIHYVDRHTRPANTTGQYETTVETNFAFQTGAAGGQMTIDYLVNYGRPTPGSDLHTGLGVNSPRNQPGYSVSPIDYNSLSGTSAGTWVIDLLPNRYYDLTLATSNVTAFVAGPLPFGQARLDVSYLVTLPSFAQAVPEPDAWVLWASGLLGLVHLRQRGRRDRPDTHRA